ncbi:MAG: low-density lipoprotein receptor repeat protein [bacterium]|nr:low-density lipoprotein receptor repeat protein [bacterium]
MRASIILALALLAAGCGNGVSLVVVDVTADAPLDGVAAFAVQASIGGKSAAFDVNAPSGSFSVNPSTQTFGIDVPKGTTGTIDLTINAVDDQGKVLASGTGSGTIRAGGRADVPVELMVVGATGDDLGSTSLDLAGAIGDMALPSTAPMLAADRTVQMFGAVTVTKSSNAVMIKITNAGDMTTGTLTFQTSGANLDQFTITNGCSGTLAPNASCSVTAQFIPTATGNKAAHFDVSASPGGSVGVDLSGTGQPPGSLSISADAPYNGNCGSAIINQTSTTFATYTVKNVGTSTTGTMTVSTGDPQFIATGCSGTLDPNVTCSITVHIKPAGSGTITSSVQVAANPGGTAPANVQGVGLKPAAFKITSSTGSFSFGSAQRNSAGNVITFTATNTGDVASNALAHSNFSGAGATSFLVTSDGCYMQSIAPAGTCTVQVEFKPLSSGTLNATLQINDGGTVLGMANVSGTGTPLWQQETLPLPTGLTAVPALTAVFGVAGDGSHTYAAGGDTYYVRDATGTWSAYTMNPAGVTPGAVGQGSAIGVNSVYLATDVGVLRSTAPTAWSAVYEPGVVQGIVVFSTTDGWAAYGNGTSNQIYKLTASGWAADVAETGYAGGAIGRTALYGTSDSDLWLGGGAVLNVGGTTQSTPLVWHRDGTGTWTQIAVATGCHNCIGGVSPTVTGLWGFGTPTTTLFAITNPVAPEMYTSATGTWAPLTGVPLGMGGSGKTCAGIWGSSPTSVWFSCFGGMFLYTGSGTWDANAQLNIQGFSSVWGSSAIDVYAVGSDSNNAGFVYHYY